MKLPILVLLMLSFVSASCIDINSASLEELDEIVWVGPATAQKIVDARPFDSVENLDKVSGIGEVKVADILEEGLACVDGEVEEDLDEEEPREEEEEKQEEIEVAVESNSEEIVLSPESNEIISLNSNVDFGLSYESKNSRILSFLPYAFSLFLIVLVGILFWERF